MCTNVCDVPLSTSVGTDDAHSTVHVETEVQTPEQPGQLGSILEVHIAHLHDRRRQRHHLQRKEETMRKGMELVFKMGSMKTQCIDDLTLQI